MITGYYRPESIQETLKLLEDRRNIPIGGGSSKSGGNTDFAVVDLQALKLDQISEDAAWFHIGSTVTLETLLRYFSKSNSITEAIKIDASRNQREQATLAGLLCTATGRSPLLTLLSAIDLKMKWMPGDIEILLGEWLPQRNNWTTSRLITGLNFEKNVKFGFESVGRSPLDLPVICLAIAQWPSGRLRVTAGGFGDLPTLVLDGNIRDDLDLALENALLDATDKWGTSEYRIAASKKLADRLKKEIG